MFFQCTVLVDYYAPLFFLEVSTIQAEDFCRKVDLCEEGVSMSQHLSKDKCDICHNVVAEALLKLKDPDTEVAFGQLGLHIIYIHFLFYQLMMLAFLKSEIFFCTDLVPYLSHLLA